MNVILERSDQIKYFTNMRLVLEALGLPTSNYEWYISDIETNYYGDEFSFEDQWMSGDVLQAFLAENDVQFIWAVFSAFPKGIRPNISRVPYIDGNPDYWSGREISPQIEDALFEIACWDSSATILVGVPETALERFIQKYPETRLLIERADKE
ncbi:hypothetical protein ACUHMQ_19950 [Chitinimonas sp. PSY-7]|uniref:hypothetical protein n=1 Tax=Chitinimonas sp. PSY-7 TaxID=3459088 RepID=UPI00404025F2